MEFDRVARRRETGLPRNTGKLLEKVGCQALLDRAPVVADRNDRHMLVLVTLAGDEGVQKLNAMHLNAPNQCRQRSVDR